MEREFQSQPEKVYTFKIKGDEYKARLIFQGDQIFVNLRDLQKYGGEPQQIFINKVGYHVDVRFHLHSDGHYHIGPEFLQSTYHDGKGMVSKPYPTNAYDRSCRVHMCRADRFIDGHPTPTALNKLMEAMEAAMAIWEQDPEFKDLIFASVACDLNNEIMSVEKELTEAANKLAEITKRLEALHVKERQTLESFKLTSK